MTILRNTACLCLRLPTKSRLLNGALWWAVIVSVFITFVHVLRSGEVVLTKEDLDKDSDNEYGTEPADPIASNVPFQQQKVIVFGSKFWGSAFPYVREAGIMCPKCKFTAKPEYMNTADAVLVHGADVDMVHFGRKLKLRRGSRPKRQVWVLVYFEGPLYMAYNMKYWDKYKNEFNWTMTHRRDSEIVVPYGQFIDSTKLPRPSLTEKWAFIPAAAPHPEGFYNASMFEMPTIKEFSGRKMAAFVSSHCDTDSKREILAKELGKYIQVDVYGNCGNLSCAVPKAKAKTGIDCRFQISNQYKFYLAFENSLCEDYVTEKYFDTLYTPMIPVVYGGANYKEFSPKKSFINVADFNSVKELADYLMYLDSHPEQFLKYFEWRKSYWVENNRFTRGYCKLCDRLWKLESENFAGRRTYADLKAWWNLKSDFKYSKQNACVPPESLPVIPKTKTSQVSLDILSSWWPFSWG